MVSQKYRGSCIGVALAKWLAKNTVASQKMALEEKMEDGALEMLLRGVVCHYCHNPGHVCQNCRKL